MRAVVQRVLSAHVEAGGTVVGAIGAGLVAFTAVEVGDGPAEASWMAEKLSSLRLFEGEDGRLDLCVTDVGGAVLVVSNFTVAGDCRKGRRPSFTRAAPPEPGRQLLDRLVSELRSRGVAVETGRFGASMDVIVHNSGPVTVIVESRRRE